MGWHLGVYYEPSPDPVAMEVSAQQIWDSLTVLHETLGYGPRWEHAGNALTDPHAITQALATGMNRKDTTGEVIPTLGQRIGIGSLDQDDLSVMVSVGGTAPTWSGVFLLQMRDLTMPDLDAAKRVMGGLVRIWRPLHAAWTTHELREAGWDAGLPKKKGVPAAGWLTWVSPDLHDPLPGPVEELAGGRLHVLAPTADEATVDRVRHVLEGTGPASTP